MTHVEFIDGLDVVVAERYVRPRIDRALDMLLDEARTGAPGTRTWMTMRDERVRLTHVEADTQTIPANLRFILDKPGGGQEMARAPRDPALSAANSRGCRCQDVPLPQPLRESLNRTAVTVMGTRVNGSVQTRFPRAAESEFGTSQDEASHFMTNALRNVARRLQSGQSR